MNMRDLPQQRSARQTWGVRAAWLLLALVAALYCGWRFAGPSPLQTDLLALLPATEADPVAEHAVDTLASALGDRTVLLVSSNDDAHAKAAAKQLGASLQKSGAFGSVTAELPPFDLTQIAALYMPYRFGLLAPADRAALAGGAEGASGASGTTLRDTLAQRLYRPLQGGLSTPLADDPFGWLERWLGGLPLATSNLEVEDNLLVAHRGATTSVLIVATLPGSAYETKTQQAVHAALAQSESALRQAFPDVSVARTGAVFYAESARSASEREVHLIGVASLCGIALLMMWVFRSPRLLLLGFVSTALGIVCALAATLLVFGKLHLLTLVFGASLIGEAVDYSIQYFVVYLGAQRDWDARRGARTVRPALTVALLTSLLGYAILMWVPFPALRQIACFAMVGITTAFASVLWLLPALLTHAPKRSPQRVFAGAARLLTLWHRAIGGRHAWYVAALLLIVAVPGWLRLTSDDDIHLLIQRDPSLVAQEDKVRDAVGVDNSAQFFVVRGDTPEAVLQRAEALGARLDALNGTANQVVQLSVGDAIRAVRETAERRPRVARAARVQRPRRVARDAVASGLQGRSRRCVARLVQQAQSQPPLSVERWLAAPWSQPYRHLWLGEVDAATRAYAAVVIPQGVTPHNEPALIALAHALPGVTFVDKAASVSKLFGAYRVDSGWWLGGALALVLVLLTVRYAPKEASWGRPEASCRARRAAHVRLCTACAAASPRPARAARGRRHARGVRLRSRAAQSVQLARVDAGARRRRKLCGVPARRLSARGRGRGSRRGVDRRAAVGGHHAVVVRHARHERDARAEELRRDARARHRGLGAARADRHAIGIEEGGMKAPSVYLHALGMINALGGDVEQIVPALAAARAPGMANVHTGIGDAFVGSVLAPLDLAPRAELARYDCRNNRLLLAALAQIAPAIDAARERYGAHRIGVVLGTSTSGIEAAEAAFVYHAQAGELPVNFNYRQMEIGTAAPFAAAALGVHGPAFTISTACTSSAKAFASARRLLQLQLCDAVVVGGVDSLCELTVQGFASLESTSGVRTNPMSVNRCGINVGEGAAVFLMSRDEAAVRLAGVGESSDAHHISSPDPQGVGGELALREALADAGIAPSAIGYVNLHATATRKNDEMEAKLMARVFPERRGDERHQAVDRPSARRGGRDRTRLRVADARARRRARCRVTVGRRGRSRVAGARSGRERTLSARAGAAGTQYVMSNSFAFGGSNVSLILAR